jgi:imidazolonepropionase-like amidohydrolase
MSRSVSIGMGAALPVAGWLVAACAGTARRAADPASEVAITNVSIVDVETGRIDSGRTVLVRGTRIVSIGPAGARTPPAGQVVPADGAYLIPGLWDMHTHSATAAVRELPLHLSFGVTGIRNMHTTVDTALQLVAAIRQSLTAGTLTGPRFVANGAIVDGPRPAQQGSVRIGRPEDARRIVDSLAAGGAEFVKVYNLLPRETYFAVVDAAKANRVPLVGHVPFTVRAEEAAAAGQRSIEHFDGLDFSCSARGEALRSAFLARPSREAWHATTDSLSATWSASSCAPAIAALARYRTWQVPTLVVAWGDAASDSVLADTATTRLASPRALEAWRGMAGEASEGYRRLARVRFDNAVATLRLVHAAGIPILAGTDVGNPFVVPGRSLHRELELLVEAGLSPLEALQAATLNPARFLEATDSLGTIAVGKLGDFVLLDGNPLTDIRQTQRIRGVMINGRYFDRASLHALRAGQ